jgi:hypothetical protein
VRTPSGTDTARGSKELQAGQQLKRLGVCGAHEEPPVGGVVAGGNLEHADELGADARLAAGR